MIAEPVSGENEKEKNDKLKHYEKTLKKVGDVLNDIDIVNEIIASIGTSEQESLKEYKENGKKRLLALLEIAGVSLDEYEKALTSTKRGYKVVQQRDLTEIYINPYNIEWMRAWNANMDIQICLDYHAVITYITDYYAKADSGLMDLINSVLTQEASEDTKERMKTVANTFMTHR